jgi:hypothetical protein
VSSGTGRFIQVLKMQFIGKSKSAGSDGSGSNRDGDSRRAELNQRHSSLTKGVRGCWSDFCDRSYSCKDLEYPKQRGSAVRYYNPSSMISRCCLNQTMLSRHQPFQAHSINLSYHRSDSALSCFHFLVKDVASRCVFDIFFPGKTLGEDAAISWLNNIGVYSQNVA